MAPPAQELKDTANKVNSADHGFTAPDMNGHHGYKAVEQGAAVIIQLATSPAHGDRQSLRRLKRSVLMIKTVRLCVFG
jgi:hypothetical protein